MRMTKIACALVAACGTPSGEATPDGDQGQMVIASLPALTGDCAPTWNDDVRALNGSHDDQMGFALQDWLPGRIAPAVDWMIAFPAGRLGVALSMDWPTTHEADVSLQIHSTNYFNRLNPHGEIQGTMTVERFDVVGERIDVRFAQATLLGEDAITSGTYRCRIDGLLSVERLRRTELGARCQTDHECGGNYAERVCDDQTFVCVAGCHVDLDCAPGRTCRGGACS